MGDLTVDFKKEVHCSVCGRNLVASNGMEIIAVVVSVGTGNGTQDKKFVDAWKEIYPELGELPFDVRICYFCLCGGFHA